MQSVSGNLDLFSFFSADNVIHYEFKKNERPALDIALINPEKNKSIVIKQAVVDSGADYTSCNSIFCRMLGHNLSKTKYGYNVFSLSGINGKKNSLSAYPHTGKIQLLKDNKPIDYLKPLNITICFLEDNNGRTPDCPFLLGRFDFFKYFIISFYSLKDKNIVSLIPRKDIVL